MEQSVFRFRFSRNVLKCIALISMVSDHIAFCFLQPEGVYHMLYFLLRVFGRISFPLFCFLLVQGFLCTKNVRKYFLRLFLFACLSEIPYDLFCGHRLYSPEGQNVLFTFGIALLVLYGLSKTSAVKVYQFLLVLCGSLLAVSLNTDYSYLGVVLTAVMYLWREQRYEQFLILCVVMGVQGGMNPLEILALPMIMFYSEETGEKENHTLAGAGRPVWRRYFFYCFYPVHMLFLVYFRMFVWQF